MRIYALLSAVAPRSLVLKVWWIIAVLQTAPVVVHWQRGGVWVADVQGASLLVASAVLSTILIALLLTPVHRVNRALERFARDRRVEPLPVGYGDALGHLMANTTMVLATAANDIDEAVAASETDALTGLLNRRGFDRLVPEAPIGALLVVDIDHFKRINDEWGHATGDEALVATADAISAALRTKDVVARIGGEEFAIFVDETVEARALEVAERVRLRVSETVAVWRRPVTVSIGVAVSDAAQSRDKLAAVADAALYEAKARGRNCVMLGDARKAA